MSRPDDSKPFHGRVPNGGMTKLVEATVVPWAPWVPEPDVCAQRVAELSVSQRHILELLAAGYTPKQAARMRNGSEKTVRNLINQALHILDVPSYPQGLIVLNRARAAA